MPTKIQYVTETWNPIVGCSKISEGCKNCYAEKMANRLAHNPLTRIEYVSIIEKEIINNKVELTGKWNGKTHLVNSALEKPLHWKTPRMIFVTSMGDLFHETVNFHDIIEIMMIIEKCPQHTFLFLTKRPERMHEFFTDCAYNPFFEPLPNLWLGVTAENQERANQRIPILLSIPAAKRFVSCEPLLGPVNLDPEEDYLIANKTIDWVIVGGESGPNARPMLTKWARSIRDQCKNYNIPFFFKQ